MPFFYFFKSVITSKVWLVVLSWNVINKNINPEAWKASFWNCFSSSCYNSSRSWNFVIQVICAHFSACTKILLQMLIFQFNFWSLGSLQHEHVLSWSAISSPSTKAQDLDMAGLRKDLRSFKVSILPSEYLAFVLGAFWKWGRGVNNSCDLEQVIFSGETVVLLS